MQRNQTDTSASRCELPSRAYRRALGWTSCVWISVLIVGWLTWPQFEAATQLQGMDALIIATASLMISYASMLPGLLPRSASRSHARRQETAKVQQQTGLLVAGVMIRLVGTVALFLTCRYQMATPTELVAGMTIGWYVLLTFVEILVLARGLAEPTAGLSDLSSLRQSDVGSPIQGLARD